MYVCSSYTHIYIVHTYISHVFVCVYQAINYIISILYFYRSMRERQNHENVLKLISNLGNAN